MSEVMMREDNDSEFLSLIRKRLLDLTAKNSLLNFRHTVTRTIRIINCNLNETANLLINEQESLEFTAIPLPSSEELEKALSKDLKVNPDQRKNKLKIPAQDWAKYTKIFDDYSAISSHQKSKLQTLYYQDEMESRVNKLKLNAEASIQETGANILYLIMGFLEWYESDSSEDKRLAPLFLIPVKIEKSKLNKKTKTYKFTLNYTGESILPNYSFAEKMRLEFGTLFPELEYEQTPEKYLDMLDDFFEDIQPRWRVHRYTTLGLANFNKLLMYLDLNPSRWPDSSPLVENQLIKKIISENNLNFESDFNFEKEYSIDDIPSIHENYPIIQDCDSSQHSALIDVMKGKNIIIEGPPGTGKSQTIANIISASMAQGKKVLFVSEKLAALEVVKRRLDENNLGDFCLELHSHKAQKGQLIAEIKKRMQKSSTYRHVSEIKDEIHRYEDLKTRLNLYVDRINSCYRNTGLTIRQIFVKAGTLQHRLTELVDPDDLLITNLDDLTHQKYLKIKDESELFVSYFQSMRDQLINDDIFSHPFYGVKNITIQMYDYKKIREVLISLIKEIKSLLRFQNNIALILGLDGLSTLKCKSWFDVLGDLNKAPEFHEQGNLSVIENVINQNRDVVAAHLNEISGVKDTYGEIERDFTCPLTLKIVNDYINSVENLGRIFKPQTSIESIIDFPRRLEAVLSEFNAFSKLDMNRPIKSALDGLRMSLLLRTLSLKEHEFRLASNLHHDDVSSVIERFEDDVFNVNLKKHKIEKIFDASIVLELKDATVLGLIKSYRKTGLFKYLNPRWYSAKSQFKSLLKKDKKNENISLQDILNVKDYKDAIERLCSDVDYEHFFGKLFNGLDTDLKSIKNIYHWIKYINDKENLSNTNFSEPIFDLNYQQIDELFRSYNKENDSKIQSVLIDFG